MGVPTTWPFDLLAGRVAHAHRQRDTAARDVHFHYFDLDHVAGLDRLVRVLDELLRQRGNMHQAVLVHADIDEGAEVGDIGHHAFEDHARLEVVERLDAVLEFGGLELGARVATGLFQLGEDVADGHQAEGLVGEFLRIEALEETRIADQRADIAAGVGGDALHQRVGFRMHGGSVQRVVAVHHAQKAGSLFEGLVAQARHLFQGVAGLECAMGIAMGDDILRQGRVEPGDAREQGGGCGVHVDTDGVDAVLDHRIERARQLELGHVVLVLADADGFRVDLHQFGQRVLQAAGDGYRTADRHVEIGEFLGRQFRGRIHRGACFADHHFGHLQAGVFLDQLGGQLIGLAAGGAVADGDQIHRVLGAQRGEHGDGLVPLVFRRMWVDGGGVEQLAGGIHHRDLAAGAQARVEAEGGARAGRGGQQQVVHVAREHRDGFVFGALAQFAEQVGFQMGVELDLPGPAHHLAEPFIGGAATLFYAEALGDHAFAGVHGAGGLVADFQAGAEKAFVAPAENRQGTVRRGVLEGFVVFEVIAELRPFLLLARHQSSAEGGVVLEEAAQVAEQAGVLGEALHQDVLGAFEHGLDIGEAFSRIDKACGLGFRIQVRVAEQGVGQLAEAGFQGDLALGAALLFVRQVKVFEAGLGVGQVDLAGQFGRQLALFLDAGEDAGAAIVQFAQVAQALFQVAQLGVIQAAGDFFTVTGDERHGGAFIEQRYGGGDLLRAHAQFFGDAVVDAEHKTLSTLERKTDHADGGQTIEPRIIVKAMTS